MEEESSNMNSEEVKTPEEEKLGEGIEHRRPPHDRPRAVHYHYYYEPPRHMRRKSSKPTIAGILLIIAAVLGLLSGVLLVGTGFFVGDLGEGFTFLGENQNGDVIGKVTLLNGTPVTDVRISIIGEPLSTVTDNDGNYVIHNVPTGNQEIKVEKEGYNTIIYKAYISPTTIQDDRDEKFENEFDFTLTPGDQLLERGHHPPWDWIKGMMLFCGSLIAIFSIIALIGGIYSIKRRGFGIALTGGILGLFTVIGTLFALIAIFILFISRDEFRKTDDGGSKDIPIDEKA